MKALYEFWIVLASIKKVLEILKCQVNLERSFRKFWSSRVMSWKSSTSPEEFQQVLNNAAEFYEILSKSLREIHS